MNTVQLGVRAPQFSHKTGQGQKIHNHQPVHFGAGPKQAPSSRRPRLLLAWTLLLGLLGAGATAVTDNPVSRMFKSEETLAAKCSHEGTMNRLGLLFGPTPYTYAYNFSELSTLNVFPETKDKQRIGVRLHLDCDCLAASGFSAEGLEPGSEAENKARDEQLHQNVEQVGMTLIALLEPYVSQRDHAAIDAQELIGTITPQLREQLAEQGIDAGKLTMKVDFNPREIK